MGSSSSPVWALLPKMIDLAEFLTAEGSNLTLHTKASLDLLERERRVGPPAMGGDRAVERRARRGRAE